MAGRHTDDDGDGVADHAEASPYVGPGHGIVAVAPDPAAVDGVVEDGSEPVPLRTPGEPLTYRRDIPGDLDPAVATGVQQHMVEHVLSIISPTGRREDVPADVGPLTMRLVEDDFTSHAIGLIVEIDAEPDAPYLREDYDPDADDDGTRFRRYSELGRDGEPEEIS